MDPNQEVRYETAVLGINKDLNGIGGFHDSCCTVAMCDGSILTFPDNVTTERLKTLLSRSSGEKIRDWWESLKR